MPDTSGQEFSNPQITEKRSVQDQIFDSAIQRASLKKGDHCQRLLNALKEAWAKDSFLREGKDYYPHEAFIANGVLAVTKALSAPESNKELSIYIGKSGGIFDTKKIIELLTDNPGQIVPQETQKREKHFLRGEFRRETTYKLPNGIELVESHNVISQKPRQLTKSYEPSRLYAVRPKKR